MRSHFTQVSQGGAWVCRHCRVSVASASVHRDHMVECPRLPEQDLRALNESEVARAAALNGMYGSNPVYRHFDVTGCRVARCRACLKLVRGSSNALEIHKVVRCSGFPATWEDVDLACHFTAGPTDKRWECRHCGASGTPSRKHHLASCSHLPAEARRALDASEVAKAAARAGVYGKHLVYRDFEVTGWQVARCRACSKTVRGGSHQLKRHKDKTCSGVPDPWAKVDVQRHFNKAKSGGGWECRHCGECARTGRPMLKNHLVRCRRLPEAELRALDESAVAKAAAGAGTYGSHPVYRHFDVVGWRVARCRVCLATVRGRSNNLERHKSGSCVGFPVTWAEVDVLAHFRRSAGSGEWECCHCGASAAGAPRCKRHMAKCAQLPAADRRALDESEVAKAAAGVGTYGNPVFRDFKVTGWRVAQCRSCLTTIQGDAFSLKRHKDRRCSGLAPKSPACAAAGAATAVEAQRSPAGDAERQSHATPRIGRTQQSVGAPTPHVASSRATKRRRVTGCGSGSGVAGVLCAGAATAPAPSAGEGAGGVDRQRSSASEGEPPAVHASAAVSDDRASGVGAGGGGASTRGGEHGDQPKSSRRWAVRVREEGGPEAVAAALRARYPRLYG